MSAPIDKALQEAIDNLEHAHQLDLDRIWAALGDEPQCEVRRPECPTVAAIVKRISALVAQHWTAQAVGAGHSEGGGHSPVAAAHALGTKMKWRIDPMAFDVRCSDGRRAVVVMGSAGLEYVRVLP